MLERSEAVAVMEATKQIGTSIVPPIANIGFVLTSVLASAWAVTVFDAAVRIRWHVGEGVYWGPEYAPAILVFGLFPVAIGAVYAGSRAIKGVLGPIEAETIYELAVSLSLVLILFLQLLVIGLNLVAP